MPCDSNLKKTRHQSMLISLVSLVSSIPLEKTITPFGPEIRNHVKYFERNPVKAMLEVDTLAAQQIALEALPKQSQVQVTSAYQSTHNNIHHVYFQQMYRGLEVVNGVGAVHLDNNGQLLQASHSFYINQRDLIFQDQMEPEKPTLSAQKALRYFCDYLGLEQYQIDKEQDGFKLNDYPLIPAKLKYIQTEDEMKLVWDFEVDLGSNWYNVQISAHDGQVLQLVDWVSHSTFTVYPFGKNDPSDGPRVVVRDPEDKKASPLGWNTQLKGKKKQFFSTTIGNNVFAQENIADDNQWRKHERPDGGKNLNFDFPLDLKTDPYNYTDAAVVNLFYWNNIIHDVFYQYGFDEPAGNFQQNNFEKGGKGNDAVIAHAQDGSGFNNANFATPPDGRPGRMRMYVWTETEPRRDGDLESGIIVHEYAHGISTRLTGGPANSGCLPWSESGGMGEGWGDVFATLFRMSPNNTRTDDFAMGDYSAGRGIRRFIYSTDMKTNPSTYGFLRKPQYWEVHAIGEVWAVILYEVVWNLIEKHGFDSDWYDLTPPLAGNKLALQLIVDGMKLQPCLPTFVDARDAILLADNINNNSTNYCDLYRGFAKRGLGLNARKGGKEDFSLPTECE
jgi:extracellular elastinolytic metalloproteinase